MSDTTCSITSAPASRAAVTESSSTGDSQSFTVQLGSGEELPTHQNPSRVVITAVRGSGTITIEGITPRELSQGEFVQLAANAPHAVVAGPDGLELFIVTSPNCCGTC